MNKHKAIVISIIVSFTLFLFEYVKFDFMLMLNSKSIIYMQTYGILTWIIRILLISVSIGNCVFAIQKYKETKRYAFLPAFAVLIVIIVVYIFPSTNAFVFLNSTVYQKNREKIVNMYERNELAEYRVGQYAYVAPHRRASHTGLIYIYDNDGSIKILFYIYKGLFVSQVLLYVSDDNGFDYHQFDIYSQYTSQPLDNIRRIKDNWYYAKEKR